MSRIFLKGTLCSASACPQCLAVDPSLTHSPQFLQGRWPLPPLQPTGIERKRKRERDKERERKRERGSWIELENCYAHDTELPPAECLLRQKKSIHSCSRCCLWGCVSLPALLTAEASLDAAAHRPPVALTACKQFKQEFFFKVDLWESFKSTRDITHRKDPGRPRRYSNPGQC